MRVAILTHHRIARLGAGDWMQARKTAEALVSIGVQAEHILYRGEAEPADSTSVPLSSVSTCFDVWHFLPGRPVPNDLYDLRTRCKLPLLACSPVYWDSLPHRKIISNNGKLGLRASPLAYRVQNLLRAAINRSLKALPYDLYLPNSQAEITVLLRDYRLPSQALVAAVPNATEPVSDVARDFTGYKREYLLCPGMFAPRKNQLGLIEALRSFSHPVVFLGGPLPTAECERYFAECKERAPAGWTFLGTVPHASDAFYDAMRRARVACLASSCETPGIALLEAAALGARPAVTREGSAAEYFGFEAEYFNPLDHDDLRRAVLRAWDRGPLSACAVAVARQFTWEATARSTLLLYQDIRARLGSERITNENKPISLHESAFPCSGLLERE